MWSRSSSPRLGAVVAVLCGCGSSRDLPQPSPEAVVPAAGWTGADRAVEIRGHDFFATAVHRLEGDPFDTDASFRVWLGEQELSDVDYVDPRTLTARVPAGLAPGLLDLRVEAPDGATAVVPNAYRAFDERPAALAVTAEPESASTAVGATFAVTLTVSNTGETTARAVVPSDLVETGDGASTLLAGPETTAADLAGGGSIAFRWTRTATGVGEIRFEASASGLEALTDDPVFSASPPSDPIAILACLLDSGCDDGSFCNGTEACASGTCIAGPATCADDGLACTVTCDEASDSCNVPGAGACLVSGVCRVAGELDPANACMECDPATSQSTWTADDTNGCDDGLFCDGVEACSAGSCTAGAGPCADDGLACTLTCDEASDSCNVLDANACLIGGTCRTAGELDPANPCEECVPATSQSAWTADDTNACDDGLFCNGSDACLTGACVATGPDPCTSDGFACTNTCDEAADACAPDPGTCLIAGTCRTTGEIDPANPCQECAPATSQAAWTADDTNACDDGNACTTGDACNAGGCAGSNTCTAPVAVFTVTPLSGTTATLFAVDASASWDLEDPPPSLEFRWDWEADGAWDTAFSATPTATHSYPTLPPAGFHTLLLQVRDSGLLTDLATRLVALSDPADEVLVTIAADENNPGATPASPGGTGLSLREAIAYANATAGRQVISPESAIAGPLVLASVLPSVTGDGDTIVGRPGLVIDGSVLGGSADCLSLVGNGQTVLGVEVTGCPDSGIEMYGTGNQVVACTASLTTYGIASWNGSGHLIADNEAFANSYCGLAVWAAAVVERNRVHDNAYGIDHGYNTASGSVIRRNFVWANTDDGIRIYSNADGAVVIHNTIHANGGDGVSLTASCGGADVRNNLFTANAGWGVSSAAATLAALSSNDYWSNVLGACSGTGCGGQASVYTDDPLYVDAALGDLRLLPGSPMVDLGVDTGIDLNGTDPGLFNGGGADIGAWEAPPGF